MAVLLSGIPKVIVVADNDKVIVQDKAIFTPGMIYVCTKKNEYIQMIIKVKEIGET